MRTSRNVKSSLIPNSSLSSIELPGPSGCLQSAPGVHRHHAAALFSGTGRGGCTKTSEPATSTSSGGFGVPGGSCFFNSSQSGICSAVVTYPVASTNARNCAFVTSVASIQKPSTRTRFAGRSSGRPSGPSQPIVNSPPGTHTIPGGESGACVMIAVARLLFPQDARSSDSEGCSAILPAAVARARMLKLTIVRDLRLLEIPRYPLARPQMPGSERSWLVERLQAAESDSGSTGTARHLGSEQPGAVSATGFVHSRALPYQPIWSGFALNTLFFAAILGIPLAPFTARRIIRRRHGLCIKCGYAPRVDFDPTGHGKSQP